MRYTNLIGEHASAFALNPQTGEVTVRSPNLLDRESRVRIDLLVEARDSQGTGRAATVPLAVHLADENDSAPRFVGLPYETSLTPDLSRLASRVRVHAHDNDTGPLNGAVRYEIVKGNYESKFRVDEATGEVTLSRPLTADNLPPLITLVVGADDLGVPHRHDQTTVDVYTREVVARTIFFIVPKPADQLEAERRRYEALLTAITGAPTTINQIQLHTNADYLIGGQGGDQGGDHGVAAAEARDPLLQSGPAGGRSRVAATVRFPPYAAVVDLERVQQFMANDFDSPNAVALVSFISCKIFKGK